MNYFDHAASSLLYPEVLETLNKSLREDFANPSAQHLLGYSLNEKIEAFRQNFLKELFADKNDSFIFTSSATESNNTVIKGLTFSEGDVVLYCKADHPSITAPVEQMAEEKRISLKEITLLPDGTIDLENFAALLNDKVKLVAMSHVNNQSGVIQDIESLAKLIKEKTNAHVHVDAVQSFGKINVKAFSVIDSMSLTSHKIGGPKGIAGLYLKKGHKVKPLILGGAQEHGLRSSTVAYPLIDGFHLAMKISLKNKDKVFNKICGMNEVIKAKLSSSILTAQFPFKTISPYIISFVLPDVSSDVILRYLEMKGIFISSSSACSSKVSGFNSSLMAMNIPERFHKNFLRISLGPDTTEKDVEDLIREFINVWDGLKHIR